MILFILSTPWFLSEEYAQGANLKHLSGPLHLFNLAKTPHKSGHFVKTILIPCLMPDHGYNVLFF